MTSMSIALGRGDAVSPSPVAADASGEGVVPSPPVTAVAAGVGEGVASTVVTPVEVVLPVKEVAATDAVPIS